MTNRTPVIAGNWKMHHGVAETQDFLERLLGSGIPPSVDVIVCPSFVALPAAAMLVTDSTVSVGSQNVHWEVSGAFTGEVAASMLTEIGVRWAIVGHSERRALFSETDDTTLRRAEGAQKEGMRVIYCVGETLEQRDAGETLQVLERQTAALGKLDPTDLVVAYEPVWAIGTGRTATPEQAQEAHSFLRNRLAGTFGDAAAQDLRLLYGGSLKPANAADLLGQPDVDGGLIGGASLDVDSFSAIIRAAAVAVAGDNA
jgi:triosephosphate isomerase